MGRALSAREALDALAHELEADGWRVQIREDVHLRLQVRSPALPWVLGETISVASGAGGA